MEQVFFNTVLGARPLELDGSSFYYSDYTFKARRVYHPSKWPCCSGTLPQIAADYRISAYFRGERGVYVNLYLPSTLSWNGHGAQFALRQKQRIPTTVTSASTLPLPRPPSSRFSCAFPPGPRAHRLLRAACAIRARLKQEPSRKFAANGRMATASNSICPLLHGLKLLTRSILM